MTARAIWKATLRLGDIDIPVKMFTAVQDRTVRFRLLHRVDQVPVKQRMINPQSGSEVLREKMKKGAPLGDGRFILLSDAELAELQPEASRIIDIERFISRAALNDAWYERPYWLAPE